MSLEEEYGKLSIDLPSSSPSVGTGLMFLRAYEIPRMLSVGLPSLRFRESRPYMLTGVDEAIKTHTHVFWSSV